MAMYDAGGSARLGRQGNALPEGEMDALLLGKTRVSEKLAQFEYSCQMYVVEHALIICFVHIFGSFASVKSAETLMSEVKVLVTFDQEIR